MIQFNCAHCGRRLRVADLYAGQQGRCPSCKRSVGIPRAGTPPEQRAEPPDKSHAPSKRSGEREALLDLAPRASEPEDGKHETGVTENREAAAEEAARLIDVFAYPANLDGLVQIVVLALGLWVAGLSGGLLGRLAGPYGGLLAIIGQVIIAGYLVFYVGYCVYDSSQGGRRAATISLSHAPDLGGLVSQLLLSIGGVAICFWPAALYRGLAGRTDVWFWSLGAAGAFFLPMSLLTATLFDGIDALNPLLIIRSILVTLPAYLGLLIELGLLTGVIWLIHLMLARVHVPRVLSTALYLYLLLMEAHLLGWFYWRRKEKLGWGL